MILHHVGYDHVHDADFRIDRPEGSGDWLLLILKTESLFQIGGKEVYVPENSLMLYPEGMPQFYRCMPQHVFGNDWLHFALDPGEQERIEALDIPLGVPAVLGNIAFFSLCLKMISDENATNRRNRDENIQHWFWLLLGRISDALHPTTSFRPDLVYEMLLTIRSKIYAEPYVQRDIAWSAHEVRMSPTSFQYYYRKHFGVTFVQDLIRARISFAQMLLTTTDMTVRDIAGKSGYRNYEHFARQFRQQCGCTPLQYRAETATPS